MPPRVEPDRVFAIDDDPAVLDVVERRLAREGYEVEAFESAEEALPRLRERPPGVVLSDLKMGGMDGIALLRALREAYGPDLPVFVLMTAYADLASAREAMRLGAYDYLEKPFSLDDLSSALGRASERARLIAAREALAGLLAEDVRVPLGAVQANLEALEAGLAGPLEPEQRELVALSLAECARLHRLARNFDDARLLERRELYLARGRVDLAALARRALERLAPASAPDFEPAWVVGDAALLERLVENLVRAANGTPRVRVLSGAEVRIEVGPLDARVLARARRRGLFSAESREALAAEGIRANSELELTFCAAAAGALGGSLSIEARDGAAAAVVRLPGGGT
jgi:CheY-like chemotaxis protein